MFISDPKKRKEFDRTSHKLCSSWSQMARKHKRLFLVTVLSAVISAAFSVLMAGNTPMVMLMRMSLIQKWSNYGSKTAPGPVL